MRRAKLGLTIAMEAGPQACLRAQVVLICMVKSFKSLPTRRAQFLQHTGENGRDFLIAVRNHCAVQGAIFKHFLHLHISQQSHFLGEENKTHFIPVFRFLHNEPLRYAIFDMRLQKRAKSPSTSRCWRPWDKETGEPCYDQLCQSGAG